MSLFDFFFPEEAQASHLRRLADTTARNNTRARIAQTRSDHATRSSEKRIRELEEEVSQLTIILEALLEKLSEDGSLSRADLAKKVAEINTRDENADEDITKNQEPKNPSAKPKFNFPKQG